MLYPVAIVTHEGEFLATVPDLPDLQVKGASVADVIRAVRNEIVVHLQSLAQDNLPLPVAKDVGAYVKDPNFLGVTWAIVSLDSWVFDQSKLSYSITLPKQTIDAMTALLGAEAGSNDIQRFILSAIQEKLAYAHSQKTPTTTTKTA